jgi:cytoskeletal protein CcmA (bactofilin family)
MFNKTDATAAPTAPAAPAASSRGSNGKQSVLAADLKISGDITSSGALEVLGEIDGTITARALTVGAEGRVTGIVTADSVDVKGRLDGKVTSDSFAMRSTAVVTADVSYQTLAIESGAQIEGRFTRARS